MSGRAESKTVFYFELLYQLVYYPAFWVCLDRGVHVNIIRNDEPDAVIIYSWDEVTEP